ncbi:Cytochrome b/b6 domain protein [Desulfobulbus propionicus DSM 2032]|jgi:ubiquinol-cytochrome c reductase cytochrome b subunit|uniref:Cytochrome b/b6 domain protein n=1 Tax=Desulfobulbus propionicus (strain ATCC 33891 / DSM 2032 / VKM B-1956 / 1pr3) TaxID=577650 RepID=A0A7U3YNK5_DESPD|nr:cytochrome b N-terminal domain-containing protein [Desulfobulbus propionicus]ADW18678.1 Cytochrome b/b6 domain protein [Desulfobulbus propionicus DSM 2032]
MALRARDGWPNPLRWLLSHPWGGGSLISLFLSVVSGIVVALQYDPTEPFYSTTTIELVVPYGSFWRALHYFSSQAFFLLLLAHVVVVLWKNEADYRRGAWVRLCATLPCGLLLLFTGYVLRGDATGEAAGAIAEHICLSVPLIGPALNDVLFDLAESGLRKVYAHHVIGLVVLGGMAAWPHLRRYTARWRNHLPLVALTVLISVAVAAPIEPNRFGLLFIAGPWFFLGLQELLRYWPPFVAGVLAPLLPLALLLWLPKARRSRTLALLAIGLWLAFYIGLTVLCLQRI